MRDREHHQLVRFLEWQVARAAVHDAEKRGRSADAEGECERRAERESFAAPQCAQTMPDVEEEAIHVRIPCAGCAGGTSLRLYAGGGCGVSTPGRHGGGAFLEYPAASSQTMGAGIRRRLPLRSQRQSMQRRAFLRAGGA